MKNFIFLFVLMMLVSSNWVTAQTATGGCTEITVSDIPPYPTVYIGGGFRNCRDGGGFYEGCDEDGRPACCKVLWSGSPAKARFYLEQLQDDGSWLEVEGPQTNTTFDNLEKGTYRVKVQIPNIAENACGTDEFGNVIKARTCIFNTLGQFVGYGGTWDNSPFGNQFPITYTNTAVVGPTNASDISYTFIDVPETGAEIAYDFGETVKMDVSDCRNYDLWWLAIFESGQTFNRYKSNGWTNGTIPGGEIDLSTFWANWNFETFHQYTVQFVVENRQCRNGIENPNPNGWNNLDRTFFICPAGSGCRFGIDEREIVISPNPANSIIQLQNFQPDLDRNYVMTITDMTGRQVKNIPLMTDRVDISGLQAGMFVVNIFREGERVFNAKLVVNQ